MKKQAKKEFAVTMFKVLSIYSFIQALYIIAEKLPYPYWKGNYEDKFFVAIKASAPALLLIAFGLIIWGLSDLIASSLFKSEDSNEVDSIAPVEIHIIAFSSVGLYLLCESIPHIFKIIMFYYHIKEATISVGPGLLVEEYSLMAYAITKLLIGLWLLLGSRGIVKVIRNTRGMDEDSKGG
jgi:hypothetical protein